MLPTQDLDILFGIDPETIRENPYHLSQTYIMIEV
jgi:hypothetical protein